MQLTGASFIGNERRLGTGDVFQAVNPADGKPMEPAYPSADRRSVEDAANRAGSAFPIYSEWSGRERGQLLRGIAARIDAAGDQIVARATLETALPLPRLRGELARTSGQLRMFAALVEEGSWVDARIDHADPDRQPVPRPDVRSMLRPLGPVAVFGASNFPLAFSVAGGDTASALAAGCPVVVKAHPAHPGTSEIVAGVIDEAARSAGAPDGVFALLFDAGHEIGISLVQHPSIQAVGFTGSRRAGAALMAAAAARDVPIPVFAEMGSVNPVCILAGAQRTRAKEIAAGLHASATLGVGQFCTRPGVVLVEECEATDALLAELDRLFAATPPGVMLTSGICRTYRASVAALAGSRGVRVRARADAAESGAIAGATLLEVDRFEFVANATGRHEIFGPVTIVVRCPDAQEIGRSLGRMEGQLTVAIHVADDERVAAGPLLAVAESIAGRVIMNAYPTGVEVCHAMVHGGPFPATGDGRSTSVGTRAIQRFTRPVCYQGLAEELLRPELRESNPLEIWRLVDGERRR